MGEEKLKLCGKCYNRAIAITTLYGSIPKPLAAFMHQDFKDKFQFTDNHEECENCPIEKQRFGKDPCEEEAPKIEA